MNKTICRTAIVALAAMSALVATAAPALAFPSGTGWSADWRYTGSSTLTADQTIPGAVLSATGTDDGHSRVFTVTLQDTSSTDGRCASVSWTDGYLNTSQTTCGGVPITFQPYSEDGDVSTVLCLRSPTTGATSHCNDLDIPSTYSLPYLRTAGWGVTWKYWGFLNEWTATMTMASFGSLVLLGRDDYPVTNQRQITPLLEPADQSVECLSGQVLDTSPASSLTECAQEGFQHLPITIDSGLYGTPFQGCIWSGLVWLNTPDPHLCLTAFVPVPN